MGKFFGKIGYFEQVVENPGVWKDQITARDYYGDIERNVVKSRSGESTNQNTVADNRISIVADAYASKNFHQMRWVEYMGVKWTISSVEVRPPRLLITIGEVYHEQSTIEVE